MAFRVGQKVVCVDAGVQALDASRFLKESAIYTITETRIDGCGVPVLGLAGVCYQWRATRFRPVVERKTDISALKALLVPGAKIRETV